MFCMQCGQALPEGAAFCSSCGSRAVRKPTEPQIESPASPAPSRRKTRAGIFYLVFILIGLSWLTLKPLAALFASGAVLTFFYLIPIRTIPVKVRLSVVGVLLALTALTESVELFREYREKKTRWRWRMKDELPLRINKELRP